MSIPSPYSSTNSRHNSTLSSVFFMFVGVFRRRYYRALMSSSSDNGGKTKRKMFLFLGRPVAITFVIAFFCGLSLFISGFPFWGSINDHQVYYTPITVNATLNNNNNDNNNTKNSWLWDYNDIRLSAEIQVRCNLMDLSTQINAKNDKNIVNCDGEVIEEKMRSCKAENRRNIDRKERKPETATTAGDHASFFKSLNLLPQCRVLGRPFIDNLAEYLSKHYKESVYLAASDSTKAKDASTDINQKSPFSSPYRQTSSPTTVTPSSSFTIRPRLIYSCESHRPQRFCGGMGDRFRGMITVFYLALLSNRRFELFHPVPVPLQQYLRPRLLAWVPTVPIVYQGRQPGDASSMSSPSNEKEGELGGILPNLNLMRLKEHRKFLRRLSATTTVVDPISSDPHVTRQSVADLRIQSNSQSIDDFISIKDGTGNLWANKVKLFTQSRRFKSKCTINASFINAQSEWNTVVGDEKMRQKLEQKVKAVNISTYFGCLYEVLFLPSDELLQGVQRVLGDIDNSHNNNNKPSLVPTGKYVDVVYIPRGNSQNTPEPLTAHQSESLSLFTTILYSAAELKPSLSVVSSSSSSSSSPSQAASDNTNTMIINNMRRFRLTIPEPFIGVQIRMGGSWAEGMHVKEPFRTPPQAIGKFIEMIADVQKTAARVKIMEKNYGQPSSVFSAASVLPSYTSSASSISNLQPLCVWPIFVSSDSKRLVNEIKKAFSYQLMSKIKMESNRTDHIDGFNHISLNTTSGEGKIPEIQEGVRSEAATDQEGKTCSVITVRGDEQYDHTDTLNLGEFISKYKIINNTRKQTAYFLTLLNHYILGLAAHTVMGQSGFGDTSFWRARREASCLFIDMRTLKVGWQHKLTYMYNSFPLIPMISDVKNRREQGEVESNNNVTNVLIIGSKSDQTDVQVRCALLAMSRESYYSTLPYQCHINSINRGIEQCYSYRYTYDMLNHTQRENSDSYRNNNNEEESQIDSLQITPAVALWSSVINI